MVSDLPRRTGRCLCGKVSFTFQPAEPEVHACHCTMCRRWSGGPRLAIKAPGPAEVVGEEFLTTYKSSEWGVRQFCSHCGTHLFFSAPAEGSGYYGVSAGALDDLDGFALTTEIFIDRKPALYAFANQTQQLTEAQFLELVAAAPEQK